MKGVVIVRKRSFNNFHIQMLVSFIIIFFIAVYFIADKQYSNNYLLSLIWLNNIAFLTQIYIQYRIFKSIINPITLFSTFLFLFSSGHLVLYSLNLDIGAFNTFERLGNETLIQTIPFLILGFTFFQLGVTYIANKSHSFKYNILVQFDLEDKTIFNIGVFFFLMGIVPYTISNLNALYVITELGYSAYYKEDTRINIPFAGFSDYVFTGIILIVIGGVRRYKLIAIVFLVFLALLKLLSGDRGGGIIFILSAYMLYIYFIRKNKVGIIPTAILVTILMSLVPTIGILRHSATSATGNFFSILLENNLFTSTLSNLGATIWPLGKIIEIFPNEEGYIFGASYLAALIYLIPSVLRLGPISEISSNILYMSPANWLMNYLGMTYGPGFTPFAEAFLNFGWNGIFALFFYGVFITKVMMYKPKDTRKIPLSIGFGILSFLLLGMSARGTFNIMLAYFFRYILIPYFIIILVKSKLKK